MSDGFAHPGDGGASTRPIVEAVQFVTVAKGERFDGIALDFLAFAG